MKEPPYEGSCLCSETRYRATGPASHVGYCHCRTCRRASGAPFVAWVTFEKARFQFTKGAPARFSSSENVVRGFCGRCGTPLTYENLVTPSEIDVTVSTLDEPGALAPGFHIWVSHKLPWVSVDDGLPQYPTTREDVL